MALSSYEVSRGESLSFLPAASASCSCQTTYAHSLYTQAYTRTQPHCHTLKGRGGNTAVLLQKTYLNSLPHTHTHVHYCAPIQFRGQEEKSERPGEGGGKQHRNTNISTTTAAAATRVYTHTQRHAPTATRTRDEQLHSDFD